MKKKVFYFIIILILFLLGSLTSYKIFINKENDTDSIRLNIVEEKKVIYNNTNDKDKYKEYIIVNPVYAYQYDLIIDDKGMTGNVYINKDKKLFISENNNNSSYEISDLKFETLYKSQNLEGLLLIYALSENGELYNIFLNSLDIKKTNISKINMGFIVTNFVNLEFKTLHGISFSNLMVLSEDGKIYEATTGIRYDLNIVSLNEEFYAYEDNTIANSYGNMIKDSNGKYLKIKYYVQLEKNSIFGEALSFIITNDNRIIYNADKDGFMHTYMYNNKIKKMSYDVKDYKAHINIVFEDNKKLEITGYFSDYYGFK